MSGSTVNTPTAVSNTAVVAKSIVVDRLCIVFGKPYEEVVAAIQSEMTAMEQEFQSWKLQLGDRGDDNKKIEPKTKKAPAKPRAKKADADVASAIVTDGVEGAESAVDASASTAAESKPKKAPAKPRAKKADVVPLNVSAEEAVVIAEAAAEPKAKKAPAKPRAKKADASSESASPSSEEPKAKKNAAAAKPRSKKSAEVVVAPVVEVEITQKDSELTEDQFEEVEVEVVEFEFEGVQYLRGKADNKLYDPETSDVIGVWNEATGQIDECSEEQDDE